MQTEPSKPKRVNFRSYRLPELRIAATELGLSHQGQRKDLLERLDPVEDTLFAAESQDYEKGMVPYEAKIKKLLDKATGEGTAGSAQVGTFPFMESGGTDFSTAWYSVGSGLMVSLRESAGMFISDSACYLWLLLRRSSAFTKFLRLISTKGTSKLSASFYFHKSSLSTSL